MILVGLVSCYREGRLIREAVRSIAGHCDHTLVLEGPAGEPLAAESEAPSTDLDAIKDLPGVQIRTGRWRTDARKRTELLLWAQTLKDREQSLWSVVLDGDEVFYNARYVRDWLQVLDWHEPDPLRVHDDGQEPYYHGRPIRLMELDGNLSWVRSRLLRLDRLREFLVSSAVIETSDGVKYSHSGNLPDRFSEWAQPRVKYFEDDVNLMRPPLPTEPFIVHRSMLRHPDRLGLRMHKQEAEELKKAGLVGV